MKDRILFDNSLAGCRWYLESRIWGISNLKCSNVCYQESRYPCSCSPQPWLFIQARPVLQFSVHSPISLTYDNMTLWHPSLMTIWHPHTHCAVTIFSALHWLLSEVSSFKSPWSGRPALKPSIYHPGWARGWCLMPASAVMGWIKGYLILSGGHTSSPGPGTNPNINYHFYSILPPWCMVSRQGSAFQQNPPGNPRSSRYLVCN